MKRSEWKRKPYVWKKSTKPMNKVGKQGKKNAKADKISKAELERKGIDCCQCCGRTSGTGRSHSNKRRHSKDLTRVALLCNFPCHNFIEYRLDAETREIVNDFIIDTNLEGIYKFEAIVALLPEDRKAEFIRKVVSDE